MNSVCLAIPATPQLEHSTIVSYAPIIRNPAMNVIKAVRSTALTEGADARFDTADHYHIDIKLYFCLFHPVFRPTSLAHDATNADREPTSLRALTAWAAQSVTAPVSVKAAPIRICIVRRFRWSSSMTNSQ